MIYEKVCYNSTDPTGGIILVRAIGAVFVFVFKNASYEHLYERRIDTVVPTQEAFCFKVVQKCFYEGGAILGFSLNTDTKSAKGPLNNTLCIGPRERAE